MYFCTYDYEFDFDTYKIKEIYVYAKHLELKLDNGSTVIYHKKSDVFKWKNGKEIEQECFVSKIKEWTTEITFNQRDYVEAMYWDAVRLKINLDDYFC